MKLFYTSILLASALMLKPHNGDGDGESEGNTAVLENEPTPEISGDDTPMDEPEAEKPAEPTGVSLTLNRPIVETMFFPIANLVLDAGTQARVSLDESAIAEYADAIRAAQEAGEENPFDSLPPEKLPQVFRDSTGRCVLAGGFQRTAAHSRVGLPEIMVAIREGTERDAVLFSVGDNADNGVRRTNKDKQRAVQTLLADPEWSLCSNSEIARAARVSGPTVAALRPAASATSERVVVIRGKATKMDTSAIGKGKGKVGPKAAAKAEKKSAKGKGSAKADPKKQATADVKRVQDETHELDRNLVKIADAVGGTEGGKIRAGVLDGALPLTKREVAEFASFSPEKIKAIAPLVTGGARMKPAKAFDFLASELSPKIVEELHNRALGSKGQKFEFETDSVKIVVTHKKPAAAK